MARSKQIGPRRKDLPARSAAGVLGLRWRAAPEEGKGNAKTENRPTASIGGSKQGGLRTPKKQLQS